MKIKLKTKEGNFYNKTKANVINSNNSEQKRITLSYTSYPELDNKESQLKKKNFFLNNLIKKPLILRGTQNFFYTATDTTTYTKMNDSSSFKIKNPFIAKSSSKLLISTEEEIKTCLKKMRNISTQDISPKIIKSFEGEKSQNLMGNNFGIKPINQLIDFKEKTRILRKNKYLNDYLLEMLEKQKELRELKVEKGSLDYFTLLSTKNLLKTFSNTYNSCLKNYFKTKILEEDELSNLIHKKKNLNYEKLAINRKIEKLKETIINYNKNKAFLLKIKFHINDINLLDINTLEKYGLISDVPTAQKEQKNIKIKQEKSPRRSSLKYIQFLKTKDKSTKKRRSSIIIINVKSNKIDYSFPNKNNPEIFKSVKEFKMCLDDYENKIKKEADYCAKLQDEIDYEVAKERLFLNEEIKSDFLNFKEEEKELLNKLKIIKNYYFNNKKKLENLRMFTYTEKSLKNKIKTKLTVMFMKLYKINYLDLNIYNFEKINTLIISQKRGELFGINESKNLILILLKFFEKIIEDLLVITQKYKNCSLTSKKYQILLTKLEKDKLIIKCKKKLEDDIKEKYLKNKKIIEKHSKLRFINKNYNSASNLITSQQLSKRPNKLIINSSPNFLLKTEDKMEFNILRTENRLKKLKIYKSWLTFE